MPILLSLGTINFCPKQTETDGELVAIVENLCTCTFRLKPRMCGPMDADARRSLSMYVWLAIETRDLAAANQEFRISNGEFWGYLKKLNPI